MLVSLPLAAAGRAPPSVAWRACPPPDAPTRWPGLTALEGVPSAFAAARDGIDALLRDRGLRRTAPSRPPSRCCAAPMRAPCWRARSRPLDERAAGAWRRDGRGRRAGLAPSCWRWCRCSGGRRCRRSRGCTRSPAAGSLLDDAARPAARPASAERLAALAQLLLAPTTAPALLVAAVVHAELATAAPFASHNGIVARAAERLVLVARGVDPTSLVVPEAGHLALRAAYESNLRGYRDGGAAACTPGCSTRPRPTRRAREASPLRRGRGLTSPAEPDMRAAPDSEDSDAAADT